MHGAIRTMRQPRLDERKMEIGSGAVEKARLLGIGDGVANQMWRAILFLLIASAAWGQTAHPILAVVFACNHCPISQMYEQRIQQLDDNYRDRGVAVVVIQPNDPKAIRIDELDSSDIGDTLDEMKIRVEYKRLRYTYLYDGETQSVTRAYGPQATPHIFIFDKERKLRYEGRIDNSYRIEQVKTQDARNAVDALLANREVPVTHTGVFGCSTKWQEKAAARLEALRKIEEQPV